MTLHILNSLVLKHCVGLIIEVPLLKIQLHLVVIDKVFTSITGSKILSVYSRKIKKQNTDKFHTIRTVPKSIRKP